jgi:signal transduction histidine kinase
MPERHRKEGGLSPAGLVALLDLVERPAAAVSDTGTILGTNQRFHDFVRSHGGGAPDDHLGGLLEPECSARTLRLAASAAPSRQEVGLTLRDGFGVGARVEVLPSANNTRLLLLVLDAPSPAPAEAAAQKWTTGLRGTDALRHDIAGPLTAILGTAELLLIRGGDKLPREIRDSIGQILDNCGRITEILHRSRSSDRGQSGGES